MSILSVINFFKTFQRNSEWPEITDVLSCFQNYAVRLRNMNSQYDMNSRYFVKHFFTSLILLKLTPEEGSEMGFWAKRDTVVTSGNNCVMALVQLLTGNSFTVLELRSFQKAPMPHDIFPIFLFSYSTLFNLTAEEKQSQFKLMTVDFFSFIISWNNGVV